MNNKQQEFENKITKLKSLNRKVLNIKRDAQFWVEKSFEKILSELDLKREEIKREFEAKLDAYYLSLRDELKTKMNKMTCALQKSLIEIPSDLDLDPQNQKKSIDLNFEKIKKSINQHYKFLSDSKIGESFKLSSPNKEINMADIFGKLHQNESSIDYELTCSIDSHESTVTCIEIFNDKIISGSLDSTIKIWQKNEGICLKKLTDHSDSVFSLSINENYLASGSADKTIKIWNLNKLECVRTLRGHNDYIHCLKFFKNGQLLSGSFDKTIKIWDLKQGNYLSSSLCLNTLSDNKADIYCLEEGDNMIIAGLTDDSIQTWNLKTGAPMKTLKGHNNIVLCLKQLNSCLLASGSLDTTIKIWNVYTGQCLTTLKRHKQGVRCLAKLNNGQFVSGSDEGRFNIWNIETGESIKSFEAHKDKIYCIIETNNQEIITGSKDKFIKIWSPK
ncbi:unnamed protein product [Brachionus calyciflorus]|uniref:Uncharacterized protein n=1 Tax=Brachionus calyciflorus TaxID=104777 RepID=A0A814GGN0_9BILA|nr:unnamed protein product [Brachionus calyciflorus]